ncbi:MAG TPA: 2-oxo acid dehydrogenase subunit E2, partial [Pyrinomonadaceae bacterium]
MNNNQKSIDLSQVIAENFGANATYVESLLSRYRSNPSLVDESWRSYFAELLGGAALSTEAPENRAPANGDGSVATVAETAPTTKPAAAAVAPTAPIPPAAAAAPAKAASPVAESGAGEALPIRGAALKIVENMETSLTVPTATSQRRIPVKLLDENRRLINKYLQERDQGKASYTHLIAWAIVRALKSFPQLNDGFSEQSGVPVRLRREGVNLGVAVDMAKKDGTRSLLVPNIKHAEKMNFAEFLAAYDDVVRRAREGKLQIPDFQGTTISLTNPGTIGTVASTPRLMAGQGAIIATGAIEYPAEYQAMAPEALSAIGISKAITISSTYDHRIIQGAESGAFLARLHELLLGADNFYEQVFGDLEIAYPPMRWSLDNNPALLGGDQSRALTIKQARVLELINAYRVRGHLMADIDPLHAMPPVRHP